MIFGLPKLYAYGAAVVIAAIVAAGIYGAGYSKAKDKYRGQLYAERAEAKAAYDSKVAENARLSERLTILNDKVDNELIPRLQSATDRGDSLAASLRNYQNRRCSLPSTSTSPAEPPGASGEPGDGPSPEAVDRALSDHLSACERDAERLGTFQKWYGDLQRSFATQ